MEAVVGHDGGAISEKVQFPVVTITKMYAVIFMF